MPAVQRKVAGFLAEVRVSQYGARGSGIVPPSRSNQRITTAAPEAAVQYDIAGQLVAGGSVAAMMPQNADLRRLQQIAADKILVPGMFGDGTAVGDFMTLGMCRLFGRDLTSDDNIPGFSSELSESTDWEPGECRYSSVGGAGITIADDGTGRQYVGGVAAGEKMVAALVPYNRTGATPNTLVGYWRSYSDAGYTLNVATHKTFTFTDTGGGLALRGVAAPATGYHVELDGDTAAITNEYFRFEFDAPTTGAWFVFGAVAHWTK